MILGKFLEKLRDGIRFVRSSHSFYRINFEADDKTITKRFSKDELESDELLLMILSYISNTEDKVIDERIEEDFPWILDYLFCSGFINHLKRNMIIYIDVSYNDAIVDFPNPVENIFNGDKQSCIEYITTLYENN